MIESEGIASFFILMADDLDVIGLLLVLPKYLFAKFHFPSQAFFLKSSIPFLKSKSGWEYHAKFSLIWFDLQATHEVKSWVLLFTHLLTVLNDHI